MTTATRNGTVRKSLGQQLDRLDATLDGLADSLNQAVATAVREGVQAAMIQLVTSPDIANVLRGMISEAQPETPRTAAHDDDEDSHSCPRPGFFARMWDKAKRAVQTACSSVGVGILSLTCGGWFLVQTTGSGLSWLWNKLKALISSALNLVGRPVAAIWSALRSGLEAVRNLTFQPA